MKLLLFSHSLLGAGVRDILKRQTSWELRLEQPQISTLLAVAEEFKPDICILDELSGDVLTLLEQIGYSSISNTLNRVVVVTTDPNEQTLFQLMKYGVRAYLSAWKLPEELVASLLRVSQDDWLMSQECLNRPACRYKQARTVALKLKKREKQPCPLKEDDLHILSLVATGLTNKEVGTLIGKTSQAITKTLGQIYQKTGTRDRTSAVLMALVHGWIPMPTASDNSAKLRLLQPGGSSFNQLAG